MAIALRKGDEKSGWQIVSVDMLLSGLKRYRLEKNPASVDILSEKDPVFAGLRGNFASIMPIFTNTFTYFGHLRRN